ncbi:MAG: hypothetical protein ACLFVQ_14890 [Chitinispirillaceae bacterium]
MKKILFLAGFFTFMIGCGNSPSKVSPITFSEVWILTEPMTQNSAEITLNMHENGDLSCRGSWNYKFFHYTITCEIMSGLVTKNDSSLTFTCSGIASYPPDEDGYVEKSPFSLTMEGQFSEGASSGTWTISFTNPDWKDWAPDESTFTGEMLSGTGVTS